MEKATFWLLSNYVEGDGRIPCQQLLSECLLGSGEEENHNSALWLLVKIFFPNVRYSTAHTILKDIANTRRSSEGVYIGIHRLPKERENVKLRDLLAENGWSPCDSNKYYKLLQASDNVPCFLTMKDKKYELYINEQLIHLGPFGFPEEICPLVVIALSRLASIIRLCTGVELATTDFQITKSTIITSVGGKQHLKSSRCANVLRILAKRSCCSSCYDLHYRTVTAKVNKNADVLKPDTNVKTLLRELAPQLNDTSVDIMAAMIKNSSVSAHGRRWERSVLQFALGMWNRSPATYADATASGALMLPSVRLLQYYKNAVEQRPGFNSDVFKWMDASAQEKKLPQSGRRGGLIFDEMSIQQDLQLDNTGGNSKLVGAVDMGAEANSLDLVKANFKRSSLATHVLQLEFLGFSGFVFPFAHFPTLGAQAYHLCINFWQAIRELHLYDFQVDFCLFDGASANRSFLKSLFKPNKPLERDMTITNLEVWGEKIIIGMDSKHVIKRLRNNAFNSGTTASCTRHLKWKGFSIVWEHWRNAFAWDITANAEMTRVHHRLSKEHIDLTSSSKMRNHLAEECLNWEMYNLMKCYSDSLTDSAHLTGTLAFLNITRQFVKFVNDERSMTDLADSRLSVLTETMVWFSAWESDTLDDKDSSMTVKNHQLMSSETREDILFCCTSLREILRKRLQSGQSVLPSRINSDVIENFFCQQRSQNHGANSNPTYLQYSKGVNSVVLGKSSSKRARKSNVGLKGALPFNVITHEPLRKRQK